MRRRTFLGLLGALAAGGATYAPRPVAAQVGRATWWAPRPLPVVLEWRYLAGRVTVGSSEIGIVVSIASYNGVPTLQQPRYELLVARQEFGGAQGHISTVYSLPNTTPSYSGGVYTFAKDSASATWGLNADGTYSLSVSSPELSLAGLTLRPVSPLVAEDGDGDLPVARFGTPPNSAIVNSDYYNDWVAIEQGGSVIGYGRLDMQTLRPTNYSPPTGFTHHWFAVAGRAGNDEVWLSAYRLVSEDTYWYCTLGRRSPSGAWSVQAFSHAKNPNAAQPLTVTILDWQQQLNQDGTVTTPARRTGKRWRVALGIAAPGDTLDLDIDVLPGQFLQGARISGVIAGEAMQEAITSSARGLVGGAALSDVRFTVAESTYSELGAVPSSPQRVSLPLIRR